MVTPDAAARAVQATMRQARVDAAHDLSRRQRGAVDAARQKASKFISTATPGRSGHARYDRASRLLRDWYRRVHADALDAGLGGPGRGPDALAVEQTAAQVGKIRTGADPLGPLRATAFVASVARTDAANDARDVLDYLRAAVPGRAAGYVASQAGVDATRGAILRHWYQRCYLDAVNSQLGLQRPIQTVTAGEAAVVAASVERGVPCQVIGDDGVPLVTAHGTRTTDIDRRLADGETGVVPAPGQSADSGSTYITLRRRVISTWSGTPPAARTEWAAAAGVPDTDPTLRWERIPGVQQSRLIGQWLDQHAGRTSRTQANDEQPSYPAFSSHDEFLTGPAEESAARMFAHDVHPAITSMTVADTAELAAARAAYAVSAQAFPRKRERAPVVITTTNRALDHLHRVPKTDQSR